MNETIIDSQKMSALHALAETNLKISEARAHLNELDEKETEYLVAREKRVMERITALLEESRIAIAEVQENYNGIKQFYSDVCVYVSKVTKIGDDLLTLLEKFDEVREKTDETISANEATVAEIRRAVLVQNSSLESHKAMIENREREVSAGEVKLAQDNDMLNRGIERLKVNRI